MNTVIYKGKRYKQVGGTYGCLGCAFLGEYDACDDFIISSNADCTGGIFVEDEACIKVKSSDTKQDKLFITEILNDLHREGFVCGGKADTMLRDWARKLRDGSRSDLPPSKLKQIFYKVIGRENW